jgi:serine protease Do
MMYRETGDRSAGKFFPVLLFSLLLFSGRFAPAQENNRPLPKLIVDEKPLSSDLKKATSFAPVIKKVSPSVVNIYSTTTVKDAGSLHPFLNDPLFRRFFGGNGSSERRRPRTEQSLGSGVIVSSDGYVLTASHVVEGADRVKVSLSTGDQEYDAKLVGTDPATDVAVLKLDMEKALPAVTLGDSEKLEVGDVVLALGNPFGVGQTVTMGIISAVGRGGFGIAGYENFIQTDAAINPGNSGGAMVDAAGRLVGINTAIVSGSGGFMGVGFAVPINMARYVMERLVTEGKVNRGYLGISIRPLTLGAAKAFDLPNESSGVLVYGVTRGSGAEKAGLKAGDVIVELNGKKVADPRTLQLLVAQTAPGAQANVRILRGQRGEKPLEKNLTVALGTLPPDAFTRTGAENLDDQDSTINDALDGVEVADLDSRTRRQFEVPDSIKGVLVVNVDPHSNSGVAGLRPGDVLMQIDQRPVQNTKDAEELTGKAHGDTIRLRVWNRASGRAGKTRDIVVENKKQE